MKVRLTASAVSDLSAARDSDSAIDDELELLFLDQLDRAMDRMTTFPNGAPPVDGFPGVRRARMGRFLYGIFYRFAGEDILILRVMHSWADASALGDGQA